MRCLVTAGPTFEPLDRVRRITNFSTGRLGTELANYLQNHGHEVKLLIGAQSTWTGPRKAAHIATFTTTDDLARQLQAETRSPVDAIFHTAAVSDYSFGKIWRRSPAGEMVEARSGKFATRDGVLMAELVPTVKIIGQLRAWYPSALLAGWKYEVEGTREQAIEAGRQQIVSCRSDLCVVNGPAVGTGYGILKSDDTLHCLKEATALYAALEQWLAQHPRPNAG